MVARPLILSILDTKSVQKMCFFKLYLYWIVEWMDSIKLRATEGVRCAAEKEMNHIFRHRRTKIRGSNEAMHSFITLLDIVVVVVIAFVTATAAATLHWMNDGIKLMNGMNEGSGQEDKLNREALNRFQALHMSSFRFFFFSPSLFRSYSGVCVCHSLKIIY